MSCFHMSLLAVLMSRIDYSDSILILISSKKKLHLSIRQVNMVIMVIELSGVQLIGLKSYAWF